MTDDETTRLLSGKNGERLRSSIEQMEVQWAEIVDDLDDQIEALTQQLAEAREALEEIVRVGDWYNFAPDLRDIARAYLAHNKEGTGRDDAALANQKQESRSE